MRGLPIHTLIIRSLCSLFMILETESWAEFSDVFGNSQDQFSARRLPQLILFVIFLIPTPSALDANKICTWESVVTWCKKEKKYNISSCKEFVYSEKQTQDTGAAVAQAVQCLTTGWTIGVRSPTGAEDFSSIPWIQNGSGAHPASYPMSTGGSFLPGKARPGRDADHSPHLVPRLSMSRSYTSPPHMPSWRVAGSLCF
jgi:hypothetical protein